MGESQSMTCGPVVNPTGLPSWNNEYLAGSTIEVNSVVEDRPHDRSHAQRGSDSKNARMLWIDGVGGFLIVAGDEWLIGGPGAGSSVEINVQGDLSRRAAAVRRQGSDYVLQPLAPTRLQGEPLDRPTLLRTGDRFQLGSVVQFEFQKTHPLSSSARLNLVSRHRTQPRADGVILLADTCVIGPSQGAHIQCSHWTSDVILFVSGDDWRIRSEEPLVVDGTQIGQTAVLSPDCRIVGETLAMSMERL
ncbi:hypothetical protein [Rosistilla oblonga]|uniref:hypothetical protein n=1 Tax=Rosistilla oblonga TaxID=2527990 RepID=UPI003A972354